MNKMIFAVKSAIESFIADEEGVTAIEYGLMAALIGLAIVTGATALGNELGNAFSSIANQIKAAVA